MTRTIMLILFALALQPALSETTLYRWVDDQGRVHYSDRQQSDAEAVEIGEPTTFTSRQPVARRPSRPSQEGRSPASEPVKGYSSVGISAPTQDQVLWNIGGKLNVSLSLQPALQAGHALRVQFNGQTVADWPAASTRHAITDVFRGTHTVAVSVVDTSGNEVAVSEPVTFYVKQSSILN